MRRIEKNISALFAYRQSSCPEKPRGARIVNMMRRELKGGCEEGGQGVMEYGIENSLFASVS
jgi:hypothetical protein